MFSFYLKQIVRESIRSIKFFFQRRFRGWDDSETWDFQYAFLKWILPRLKRVKKISIARPIGFTEESWNEHQENLIQRVELAIKRFDNLGEFSIDDDERFFGEVDELIQEICKQLRLLSW